MTFICDSSDCLHVMNDFQESSVDTKQNQSKLKKTDKLLPWQKAILKEGNRICQTFFNLEATQK